MKKTLQILSILIATSIGAQAQNVNILDANFKAYLLGRGAINTNSDSEIQVSEAASYAGYINCSNQNISDMTGIEAFTSITDLKCYSNNLTSLNISQNVNLTSLRCESNALTTLDLSQNTALTFITCMLNDIISLDFSTNTALETIACYHNDLSAINVSQNINLVDLICNNNNLVYIDVSQNAALERLQASENNIATLDLSNNLALDNLQFRGNILTSIDLSANTLLTQLDITNNDLSSLDLSLNNLLEVFSCNGNNLTSLDLSNNPALTHLICQQNDLTALNMKNLSTIVLTAFVAHTNPNLTCIEVDDVAAATAAWTNKDPMASFNLDCNYAAGINDIVASARLSIYPNPAKDQINISIEENIKSISVLDLYGRKIQSVSKTSRLIDVSGLTPGIYLLQVELDDTVVSKRFTKK